jgi:hypothetical protein
MRDARILAASLVVLVILAAITVAVAPPPEAPPLSVRNADRDGAMALQMWLRDSGYDVREVLSYNQLDDVDVLFVLEPELFIYSDAEAQLLQSWVEEGHTLIIAGTPLAANALLTPYDLSLNFLPFSAEMLSPAAPSLVNPPFGTVRAEAVSVVETERADVVPHLFSIDQPVLVSASHGAGRVWVSGALRPFTNLGLQDPGSARLVANLLAGIPATSTIGFDEAAHGYGDPASQSLSGWLFGTAPGLGIVLALVVTMAFLTTRGKRFGRAVPLPDDRLRRESVEYIYAIATLFRRSGQRSEILRHYDEQLRRRLSERYAVDPKLDAIEFVKTVVYRDPTLDEAALRDLMKRLSQTKVSEQELIRTASDVDQFLRRLT